MTSGCTVCGAAPSEPMRRSLRGELTCVRHPADVRCLFCARSSDLTEPGWSEVSTSAWRCPSCSAEAVDTEAEFRRHVVEVRRITRDLGFGLSVPVRVVLAPGGPGPTLAHTELVPTGPRTADVTLVRVTPGPPAFLFGRSVAHEVGHAWLAQAGARPQRLEVEEGVCELVSYAWLKRSGLPHAEAVRDMIRRNPDPTYGAGFREVHAAVRRHGLRPVLASLADSGELPP
ncbi:protein DA1 [Actinophytocola gossypii]|uniref:Protein DA1 n=1 Tax=Actinophytocola gossypii TaxID=2812003 RepID=A0ABT2JLJ5_9PSEU|nr:protein DA1 [Actinophytocola gossypii]MCT2588265.1 protein DA1 [Actinophytocola gossypii]